MLDEIFSKLFQEGRNICLTGPGGCGKSYMINEIAKRCKKEDIICGVTSTTGCSALNLHGGRTLHSFLHIFLARETPQIIARNIMKSKRNLATWTTLKLLIIDECSMLGLELFEKLNEIAQIVRKNTKPFGGIRLLLSGDFYQLSPVNDSFIFESPLWDLMNFHVIEMIEPKRYSSKRFFNMLLRIREGEPNPDDIHSLRKRHRAYKKLLKNIKDGSIEITDIIPTVLYGKKVAVEEYNTEELSKLDGEKIIYTARDRARQINSYRIDDNKEMELEKDCPILDEEIILADEIAPRQVEMRIGAQVMLTHNLNVDDGLVNGSRGVVIRFGDPHIEDDPKNTKNTKNMGKAYPIVKFVNGSEIMIEPMNRDIIVGNKRYIRTQIPLILAWALTIHKTQSATLDSVVVDIGKTIFADGQAYVALSRVRKIRGLYISSFDPNTIKASKKVREFYDKLKNIPQ